MYIKELNFTANIKINIEIVKSHKLLPKQKSEDWELGIIKKNEEDEKLEIFKYTSSYSDFLKLLESLEYLGKEPEEISIYENLLYKDELKYLGWVNIPEWDNKFNYGYYFILIKIYNI